MNKLLLAGAAAGMLCAVLAYQPALDAGWGPPFAAGSGPQTAEINWDQNAKVPGEVGPAITGILAGDATKATGEEEYTIEELEAGKPLLVYYVNLGNADASVEGYKFSQSFEVKVLQKDKIVEQINENWRAKKVALELDSDRSKPENQTRIEFFAFTGEKLGDLTTKDSMSSRVVQTRLRQFEAKNKSYCAKEIKRLEKAAKAAGVLGDDEDTGSYDD